MTQKETIKKVLHYIRRYRFFLIASLVLALITVVLTLYVPILTGQAVDLIVGKGQVDFAGVYRICVKIGIAILLTMVAQWVMNVANNKITYSVVRDIRTDAFEKIQVLPLSYIDSHSYGGIVSRVIADADQFADARILDRTREDLCCAGTVFVHEDHQRQVKICPLAGILGPVSVLILHIEDQAFRQQMFCHRAHRSDASARVAPEVDDQALHTLPFQLLKVLGELVHRHVVEFGDLQISDPVVEHLGFHCRRIDPASLKLNLYLLSVSDQGQRDLCSLFAPNVADDFIDVEP